MKAFDFVNGWTRDLFFDADLSIRGTKNNTEIGIRSDVTIEEFMTKE